MGLGAPFWFDVAKRLAQIRQGLNKATASAESRMSGRDANGDARQREEIVERVVNDAVARLTASASRGPAGGARPGTDEPGNDRDG